MIRLPRRMPKQGCSLLLRCDDDDDYQEPLLQVLLLLIVVGRDESRMIAMM